MTMTGEDILDAARTGNTRKFKKLHLEEVTLEFPEETHDSIYIALENGHTELFKWMEKNLREFSEIFELEDIATDLLAMAIETGDVEFVKWFIMESFFGDTADGRLVFYNDLDRAAAKGDLNMLKFLLTCTSDIFSDNASEVARRNGHNDVADWMDMYKKERTQ